jgi:CRISPR locus-related DNA-binding protein|uniref:CRISPR locus-related DNA-binding protein n=1 Tax=Ignisphaera aggregans TaxID=334771 RepID=A0A7J2TB19_9CREN
MIHRRVVIVSVGHNFERPFHAVARVGVGKGDVVILVNSMPITDRAEEVMKELSVKIGNTYGGVIIETLWLDPRNQFEENIAVLRRTVERYAPCEVFILAVGGFRWLSIALLYLAQVLKSIDMVRGFKEIDFELELEEDTISREIIEKLFPTQQTRVIRIPIIPKLIEITAQELKILETISNEKKRIKDILTYLNEQIMDMKRQTLQRKLRQLAKKELIVYRPAGKQYIYELTSLGKMFV